MLTLRKKKSNAMVQGMCPALLRRHKNEVKTMANEEKTTPAKAEMNPVRKFRQIHSSRAAAIKAKCSQCMGCSDDYIEPGFRTQVRDCTAPDCALWGFRPWQMKTPDNGEYENDK